MPISVVFDPPLPSDSPSTFNTKAFTLLGDLNDWSTQANALPGEVATNLTTLLAAPPAIGSTTPAAGSFTTLSASGAVTLTAANPYISFVGTSATQNWRLGDGLGAVNGNLVLYDYTSSVKAIEVTKGTGAVTIPGATSFTGGTFGYGIGAGGTVTQATSKSTAVTLNKPSGQITMHNAALAAGDVALFQVTNSVAVASSIVLVSPNANPAGEFYSVWSSHTFAGGFIVCVKNITAGSRSEALVINFAVLSGATS